MSSGYTLCFWGVTWSNEWWRGPTQGELPGWSLPSFISFYVYVCIMYASVYGCVHLCIYVCIYVCVHVCMHVCVYDLMVLATELRACHWAMPPNLTDKFDTIIFGAVGRLCQRKCLVQSRSLSTYMLKCQVQLLFSESIKDTMTVIVQWTRDIKM